MTELTEQSSEYWTGNRIDRISASLGYAIVDKKTQLVDTGIGYSTYGDYWGETAQLKWHSLIGNQKDIDASYTDGPPDDVFVYMRLFWVDPNSRFFAKASAIFTTHGELSSDVESGISYGRGTISGLYQARYNGPDDRVVSYSQKWENDWFIKMEFDVNHVRLAWLINNRVAAGVITIIFP